MRLGESVIITLAVSDLEKSISFYEKLGFLKLAQSEAGAVMADGQVRLSLQVGEFSSPVITYFAPDIKKTVEFLKDAGMELAPGEVQQDSLTETGFTDLDGQPVMVVELKADDLDVPFKKAKCGIFGEFSIPVKDMKRSVEFYSKLGFERVGGDDENPYPWAIMKDGLFIIGLHQSEEFTSPLISYFAGDMAHRIEMVRSEGVAFVNEAKNEEGQVIYVTVQSPDGQLVSMFYAEGFEDGTSV